MIKISYLSGYKSVILFVAFLLLFQNYSKAQFYNGHQMHFGKNRVQYSEFEWYYYRFSNFDTYFYLGGSDIAKLTAQIANKKIPEIEKYFDYKISQRLIFVVYNNLSEFRQSNIGLNTGDDQYNIGGVTKIIDNIVFLYVEGDRTKLEQQISAAISEVILNEMLWGSEFTNKLANNTLISLPDWYYYGLISYVSQGWNYEIDDRVRDGILSGKFEEFNHLTGDDAVFAGHSIWNYIASNYGQQVIPTIVYLTRITKNAESGFLYVLGSSLKILSYDWLRYYENLYLPHSETCEQIQQKDASFKTRKKWTYYSPAISPDGRYVAYSQNFMGRYKVVIYDEQNEKRKTILRREHKLEQITDYTYPILAWHPGGELLGYIIEKQGDIWYCTYNISTKETNEKKLALVDKVNSFSYSTDGLKLVMSGFYNGMSDIFIFNIPANTFLNITKDVADDYSPDFIGKSNKIIFASNRDTDTLPNDKKNFNIPTQKYRDLFVIDADKPDNIIRLTETPFVDEFQPKQNINDKFYYLSNENGIQNRYLGIYDSIISHIDTTTHYRYFTRNKALTNYPRNINSYDFDNIASRYVDLLFYQDRYLILSSEIDEDVLSNNNLTPYRQVHLESLKTKPQAAKIKVKGTKPNQDGLIDINNYSFSEELKSVTNADKEEFDSTGYPVDPRLNKYFTTFYSNYVVNQIDFGFLSSSYQPFTGSAFYFNPGFNVLLKLGAQDLFENYRITGGVRFAGNFDSNEYLIGVEDLSKRLNKQFIFHRLALNTSNGFDYIKTHSHELMYIMRYPFNQVSALQWTVSARNDRRTFLSLDYQSLNAPNDMEYWGGLKMEYVFDNSRVLMENIYDGIRFKIFGEYYRQIDAKESDLYVVGADFRFYQPIHRNLIIAARFAGSGSLGRSKLVYYLGGIDNWINLSTNIPTFDPSVRIDPEANYVYQAVATNMRGFSQNIRNGTNFALINTEIRWPVVSYFVNRPINSAILQNLQVVGFFDIGSAWNGWTPFSGGNAYENDIYENNPVIVIIDNNNYPIVAGYGFGLRTKLFGYFIRADWAWGIENNQRLPGIFYLSLSLDF
jgi:hypothetical protein